MESEEILTPLSVPIYTLTAHKNVKSTGHSLKVVLHGTILGPLLLLLYFNDLPNCLSNSDPRMYADDTHLTYADRDIDSILVPLNQDLININHWVIVNKLTLITSDRI